MSPAEIHFDIARHRVSRVATGMSARITSAEALISEDRSAVLTTIHFHGGGFFRVEVELPCRCEAFDENRWLASLLTVPSAAIH